VSRRRMKGFTLLELMTSMVITIIILLAVAAAFTAVQGVYQREAHLKGAVENGRVATAYIERVTRYLGYGIDPRYAIDLSATNLPGAKSNYTDGVNITPGSTGTIGFITDDFAFRYRDPTYMRRGSWDGTKVDIVAVNGSPATFGIPIPAGRLIQVVCTGGQEWVVVKTGAAILGTANTVNAGSANVTGNATSFPAPVGLPPCFAATGASLPYVMIVREVRLRVIPLGVAQASGGNGVRPFLVAYNRLDAVGTDFDPIAADVESFQVSYVMNRNTGTPHEGASGDWILGNKIGETPVIPTDNSAIRPTYDLGYADAARFTTDVANVRAVSFELSTRSLRRERRLAFRQPRLADDPSTPLAAALTPDGFFHNSVSTTVRTPNLTSRTTFTPPLRVAGDPSLLNEWGG
jgi:type IV pilus assembly protein PilW